ncbi:uncharacterized protein LOC142978046 [Anticarsia gemmatalis]|uniref:uncharacterized protein LOC142978046 n=1 Tax=Anticarsia gemmatalis TaxID=129554 RepID=UPI003F77568E
MKFVVAFTLLVASISALPQEPVAERFLITDQIISAIEDVIQDIKDAGLDPLHIKREAAEYALPVPVIFNAAGFVDELLCTGLSNIVINHINYDTLNFRLTLDLELPHIHFSIGSAAGEAVVFDNKLSAEGSGSVDIRGLRVRLVIRVGIFGGITIRNVDTDSSLLGINSNLRLRLLGYDLSAQLNKFLGETVQKTHTDFKRDIDELISIVLLDVINENIL